MLADPFVLGSESLPRVGDAKNLGAEYLFNRPNGLSMLGITVRHGRQAAKNGFPAYLRHNVELRETVFETSTLPKFERWDWIVSLRKEGDQSIVNLDNLADYLIAGANANYLKILGGES